MSFRRIFLTLGFLSAALKQQFMFGVTTLLDMFTGVHFASGVRHEPAAGQRFNGPDGHDRMGAFLGSSPTPGKFGLLIDGVRLE